MKEIRVLVISHMYPKNEKSISGIFIKQQLKSLIKQHCKIKIISPVPYVPKLFRTNLRRKEYSHISRTIFTEGIPIYCPRYIRAPGSWFHGISCYTIYYGIIREFNKIIEEFQPHILHTYTITPDGYAGLMFRKKYRFPVICSLLGSDINVYPNYKPLTLNLTKKAISNIDQLISVSQSLKFVAESIALPKREIEVVYMGCDINKFINNKESRKNIREKLYISPKEVVLLFVGSLLKQKGIFDLVEAFNQTYKKYKNLRLIFVGKGFAYSEIVNKLNELQFKNKIYIVGEKSHNKIPDWLNASDIFVFPSHSEGLPNVVIEAMACGKPVIATKVGGIPEAVQDGKSGILIEKGDIKALSNAINYLIRNKQIRISMGNKGRKIVEEKFTWNKSSKILRKIYDEVLLRQN